MRRLSWLALCALVSPIFLSPPGCACGEVPVEVERDPVQVPEPVEDAGEPGCAVDEDCPFGDVCEGGACRPSGPALDDDGCWSDSDCPEGERCAVASGRCVDGAAFPDGGAGGDDGVCDENETRFCGTKVGACAYGVERCAGGAWSGTCEGGVRPAEETCNGVDDDCDGEVDEGFALGVACSDGLGACEQLGVTVCSDDGASAVCSAVALDASGRVELCANNVDDDCDGERDEGFDLNVACDVGVGACARSGVTTCSADGLATMCSAQAGAPADAELCANDPDDDCDGVVDDEEGFATLGDGCAVGEGACRRTGQIICSADELGTRCSATAGTAAATELCGGNPDDDCDGEPEEGFAAVGTACSVGTGACQVPGLWACSADRLGLVCVPTASGTEVCDGADNDADTCIDEDFDTGVACNVGEGICRSTGLKVCRADESDTECDATAGAPNAAGELCGNDLDDDCDADVDEGFPDLNASCSVGVGICRRTGVRVCSADGLGTECSVTAGAPNPDGELCGNNRDDDCDGDVDELDGFDIGAPCSVGVGACQRDGTKVCSADGTGTVCSATPAPPGPAELCGNGVDDNCDGNEDEGFDLGASCTEGLGICARAGEVVCDGQLATKCSATAGQPNPLGELCDNGEDDDCNGTADEGFPDLNEPCQVGLGECRNTGVFVCSADLTATVCSVSPGASAPETCDNLDNDCNGFADNGCDDDADDYCDASLTFVGPGTVTVCPLSNGSTLDCNDEDANVNPGEAEICFDARDQNCVGGPSDGCPVCDQGVDRDFDGSNECFDCDDTNGAVYPGAAERCDGLDNDCDESFDEDFDGDDDGYTTCGTVPAGGSTEIQYVDCNDANAVVHPEACELCAASGGGNAACGNGGIGGNSVDEDCDGYPDEGCNPCNPNDTDGDDVSGCEGDCDTSNGESFPGNPERCDQIDNDCNKFTTENCGVGDDCWPTAPEPDACREGLICVGELGPNGATTGNHSCTSWCNATPLNGGLGDGCQPNETCSLFLTPTANLHGCQPATDIGTRTTGQQCDTNAFCRSGDCYPDQGPKNIRYCTDFCGNDAYCSGGTVCQAQSYGTAMCRKPLSGQTVDVGGSCSGDPDVCRAGDDACLDINGSDRCSRVCCTNSDCPSDWYCALRGPSFAPQSGGIDTVPMCWPKSASNGGRPAGAQCDANADCASEFCDRNLNQCVDLCCNDDTCPTGLSCQDTIVEKSDGSPIGQTFARVCVNVTPAEPLEKK